MKILVIGAMHGNEPLGPAVVKLFEDKPVVGVVTLLANEQAYKSNCRFVKNDLNRTFPGNIKSRDYETKRAAEVLAICTKYDIVLDFHNTYCPQNDCTFVGKTAKPTLYAATGNLGLRRVIVADYNCINKFASNCISVEISLNSKRNNPEFWYKKIAALTKKQKLVQKGNIIKYRFAYRLTTEDRDKLDLRNSKLKAFKPITKKLANALSVSWPAYPIFIGDGYTPYNYGGLVNKITP